MEKSYIYNPTQAYFYIFNGINPIEPPREHYKTHKVFFVFDKDASKNVHDLWINNNK